MDIIEKVKAEIERRKELCLYNIKNFPGQGFAYVMEMTAYDRLLSFINSLQEQPNTEETELNSLAFLEQMGYTCIPPKADELIKQLKEEKK